MRIIFQPLALEQYSQWAREDKKAFKKIIKLLEEVAQNPFTGTGKPEPLKHELAGCWSRRITKEHRLIYKVTDSSIIIIACRYHY